MQNHESNHKIHFLLGQNRFSTGTKPVPLFLRNADQKEIPLADRQIVQIGNGFVIPQVAEHSLYRIDAQFLPVDEKCGLPVFPAHVADHDQTFPGRGLAPFIPGGVDPG
ncbi:hypothetical protein SDC9_199877 [bioreactor metagenome]|uniref:Uncharacterized protein n=1 Tax=bioreactor metagenome TaxID=1076179 RepID=A0A645ILQ1_9ZZZZ